MPNLGALACIQKKARGGNLSEVAMMHLKKDIAEFRATNPTAGEAQVADHALFVAQNRVKFSKLQTALQIDAAKRINARAATSKDVGSAMMAMVVRDPKGQLQGENIEARWQGIMRIAQGKFSEGFERYRTTGLGLKQDKAGLSNLIKEMFGEDTGDVAAKQLADVWKTDVDPFLYKRMRAAGGNLTPRKDWNVPQYHDPKLVSRVSLDEWKDKIRGRLNRREMIDRETGMPLSDERLEEILDEAYESVSLNGLNREGGAGGSAKMANRHTAERVFVFKSADDFLKYDAEFGSGGDMFSVMTGHIDRMSREVAILEVLGPNPDASMAEMVRLTNLSKAAIKRNKSGGFFGSVTDTSPGKALENTYNEITGRNDRPGSDFGAAFFAGTRNMLTAAQLGGAYLSALTDWNFLRLAANFNGLSSAGVAGRAMSQFVSGAFGSEGTEFAVRLGLGAEAWANSAFGAQRMMGDIVGPQITRRIADSVLRVSMLTPWTQAARHAFGLEVMGVIGKATRDKTPFNQLEPGFREALERRDFTEADWQHVLSANVETRSNLPYASLINVSEKNTSAANKLSQFITEETEFATPSGSARVRAMLKQGTQPGTIYGEVARSVAMYKQFPFLLIQTHLYRGLYGAGETHKSHMGYMADLVISTTIMGAVAMQAKQIAAGKDPIPMGDTPEAQGKFWAAAMLQGGALGIFGDFLLSDQSRFGKTFTQSAAGPVFNLLDDVANLTVSNAHQFVKGEDTQMGREATRFFRQYAPGSSLWYTRLAFERIIVDRMQTMLDPRAHNSFKQREAKQQQDFGSDYWWAPGDSQPNRAPNITGN